MSFSNRSRTSGVSKASRVTVKRPRTRDILHHMAERFVNRNVGIGSSTHDIARQNLTDLSEDMIIADHACEISHKVSLFALRMGVERKWGCGPISSPLARIQTYHETADSPHGRRRSTCRLAARRGLATD